MKERVRETTQL
jgi:hypothetical protein